MWPGIISMNFAITCIIMTTFGLSAPIVGYAASLFFVGGAALLFAKTLFYDIITIGVRYLILKHTKVSPSQEAEKQQTLKNMQNHINNAKHIMPLWSAILFTV